MENKDRFTINQIKEEAYYYIGKRITDYEAQEILAIANFNKSTPLGEIIEQYYTFDF